MKEIDILVDLSNYIHKRYWSAPYTEFNIPEVLDELVNNIYHNVEVNLPDIFNIKDSIKMNVKLIADTRTGKKRRLAIYPSYKGTRKEKPEVLTKTFEYLSKVTTLGNNYPIIRHQDLEADDVIATITVRNSKLNKLTLILSTDRDFLGLLDNNTRMVKSIWEDGFQQYTIEDLETLVGIKCGDQLNNQIVTQESLLHIYQYYKALVGDPGDNISGVYLVGPVKAKKIIKEAGKSTTEKLGQAIARIVMEKHGGKEQVEKFKLSYQLIKFDFSKEKEV